MKSHQDSNAAYANLTLAAQMNCDADNLATAFHETSQGMWHPPLVPLLPHTCVQLEVQGRTITGHYKTKLREQANLPQLKSYLKHRFAWNDDVIDDLDWETFEPQR